MADYEAAILQALRALDDGDGVSRQKLRAYLAEHFPQLNLKAPARQLSAALKSGLEGGVWQQPKGPQGKLYLVVERDLQSKGVPVTPPPPSASSRGESAESSDGAQISDSRASSNKTIVVMAAEEEVKALEVAEDDSPHSSGPRPSSSRKRAERSPSPSPLTLRSPSMQRPGKRRQSEAPTSIAARSSRSVSPRRQPLRLASTATSSRRAASSAIALSIFEPRKRVPVEFSTADTFARGAGPLDIGSYLLSPELLEEAPDPRLLEPCVFATPCLILLL